MINDYLWTTLYAQRQAQLRARARSRGGDTASSGTAAPGPVRRLLVRLGLRRPQAAPAAARPATATAATSVTAGLVFPAPGVGAADRQPTPASGAHHEEAA